MLALDGPRLPAQIELAEYLAAHDIYVQRTTHRSSEAGRERQAFVTWPVPRERLTQALARLERAAALDALAIRALEEPR
jgi:hypothetical protein